MPSWALRTDLDLEAVNVHLDALQDAGLLGVVEVDGQATVYFPERVEGLPLTGRWEQVADRDWNALWRAQIEPVEVAGLTIAPPWRARPSPRVIVIEPGQAFGTGHHETTTACLEALARLELADARVLDVGTGTGVLAIAAARLGAARVVAVDTDPLAVEAAAVNAAANGVAVDVRGGSVDDVAGPFDVVLANLDTDTLGRLAGALAARLAVHGTLVASGVSAERRGEAAAALAGAGLEPDAHVGRQWVVFTARPKRRAAGPGLTGGGGS